MTSSREEEDGGRSPLGDDEEDDLINPGSPIPFEDDISEDDTSIGNRSPLPPISSYGSSLMAPSLTSSGLKLSLGGEVNNLTPEKANDPPGSPPNVNVVQTGDKTADDNIDDNEYNERQSKTPSPNTIFKFKNPFSLSDSFQATKDSLTSQIVSSLSISLQHPLLTQTQTAITASLNPLSSNLNLSPLTSPSITSSSNKRPASPSTSDHHSTPIRPIPERLELNAGISSLQPYSKRPFFASSLANFQPILERHFIPPTGAFQPIRLPSTIRKEES